LFAPFYFLETQWSGRIPFTFSGRTKESKESFRQEILARAKPSQIKDTGIERYDYTSLFGPLESNWKVVR
jgi:hypothetical protein